MDLYERTMELRAQLDNRIAVVNGWKNIKLSKFGYFRGRHPQGQRWRIPECSGSLDQMRRLEGELNLDEAAEYIEELERIAGFSKWLLIHATPEEKAEAWLKVKERQPL